MDDSKRDGMKSKIKTYEDMKVKLNNLKDTLNNLIVCRQQGEFKRVLLLIRSDVRESDDMYIDLCQLDKAWDLVDEIIEKYKISIEGLKDKIKQF